MPAQISTSSSSAPSVAPPAIPAPFGVNEVRLSAGQWLVVLAVLCCLMWLTPRLWARIEQFETGPDYRLPYDLSKDYWLYARRVRMIKDPTRIVLLGDSVIWGEYVLPDGTLSHFLNRRAGREDQFVNGGINGMFPLAEEGLVQYYAHALHGRKILLHCNMLWMSSAKADLSTDKEEQFNHSRLVPQFSPRIPCYKASANERLSAIIENRLNFFAWINHLQCAYFDQRSILNWTLQEDGGNPPRYPNVYKNPLAQVTLKVPSAPEIDRLRGRQSPRHRPWSEAGQGTTQFDWVPLESSLQWKGFERALSTLRERGNDVLVLVGPFNSHMLTEDNKSRYGALRDHIVQKLRQQNVTVVSPDVLPSQLYADASHPLTQGYEALAEQLYANPQFRAWLNR